MGQGGRGDRLLGEDQKALGRGGIEGIAEAMGGRAEVLVDRPEAQNEQGLRAAV